jgi:hypothetical protein
MAAQEPSLLSVYMEDPTMQDALISSRHFDTLNHYHATLVQLPQQADRIKKRLGIGGDPRFLTVYQPALNQTLWLASNRLAQWPDLSVIYPRAFHEQQRVNADIRQFSAIFEATLASMPAAQRRDYLSKLDLRQLPFLLEGKLLVLRAGPAWPFAQQMKAMVSQTLMAFHTGAGIVNQLHQNNREILPRFMDFMRGALETYVRHNKPGQNEGDANTAAVNKEINQMGQQQQTLIQTTEQLSEGFNRLVNAQSVALTEFRTLQSTVSSADFQLMVELAIPSLNEAEQTARQ